MCASFCSAFISSERRPRAPNARSPTMDALCFFQSSGSPPSSRGRCIRDEGAVRARRLPSSCDEVRSAVACAAPLDALRCACTATRSALAPIEGGGPRRRRAEAPRRKSGDRGRRPRRRRLDGACMSPLPTTRPGAHATAAALMRASCARAHGAIAHPPFGEWRDARGGDLASRAHRDVRGDVNRQPSSGGVHRPR